MASEHHVPAGLVPGVRAVGGQPFVLALDGRSGSGKTVLAGRLRVEFARRGVACTVVHLDDMYPGWAGLAAALPQLCSDVLVPLKEGRTAGFTTWDWHADRPGPKRDVPATEVVIVEGVGSGATCCPDLVDLVVWLELEGSERRRRALLRDGETFAPHWDQWAAQEEALFAERGGAGQADVVLEQADVRSAKELAQQVRAMLLRRGAGRAPHPGSART